MTPINMFYLYLGWLFAGIMWRENSNLKKQFKGEIK